jgi:hypothetical protein
MAIRRVACLFDELNKEVPLRCNQRKGIFYGYHSRYDSVEIQRQAELRAAGNASGSTAYKKNTRKFQIKTE